MSVNSAGFLLFLAAGVVLYYAVPKKVRYLVLLAASVCFYLFYSVKAAVYLLVTVVLTYVCGLGLGALRGKEEKEAYLIVDKEERRALKRSFRRRRRLLLGLVLALNFATLALFKYLGSWIIGVNRIFGTSFRPLKLLLPLYGAAHEAAIPKLSSISSSASSILCTKPYKKSIRLSR